MKGHRGGIRRAYPRSREPPQFQNNQCAAIVCEWTNQAKAPQQIYYPDNFKSFGCFNNVVKKGLSEAEEVGGGGDDDDDNGDPKLFDDTGLGKYRYM